MIQSIIQIKKMRISIEQLKQFESVNLSFVSIYVLRVYESANAHRHRVYKAVNKRITRINFMIERQ